MRSDYTEHRERLVERLKRRAAKRRAEADADYEKAKDMASVIPSGQPIIVGHHSEQRDRNYRSKITDTFGRSFEKQKQAEELERRAEAAEGRTAIDSDDPEALAKLRQELAGMEESHAQMKAVNVAWRKEGRPLGDVEAWQRIADASGISRELADELREWNVREGRALQPFQPYALSNSTANQSRIRKRIAVMEQLAEKIASGEDETHQGDGFRVVGVAADNRVRVFFDEKPSKAACGVMKRRGFRWSPRAGAWQRHLSTTSVGFAVSAASCAMSAE